MTQEEWKRELNRVGVFNAVVTFVEQGKMTKEEGAKMLAHTFAFYSEKVREAKSEVRRTDAVLTRMDAICDMGRRAVPWNGKGPHVEPLAYEVRALDGWVMSLYETDLTMMRLGAPDIGRTRAREMAASMDVLWEKRLAAYNMRLKGTGEFKLFF
jgi:hypothetical protein